MSLVEKIRRFFGSRKPAKIREYYYEDNIAYPPFTEPFTTPGVSHHTNNDGQAHFFDSPLPDVSDSTDLFPGDTDSSGFSPDVSDSTTTD